MALLGVGEAATQSVSIESVDARSPVLPCVGNAGRACETLIVVQKDPVLLDEGELIRVE